MLPYETETHSSKRLNDPTFLSEPARPMKARHRMLFSSANAILICTYHSRTKTSLLTPFI